MRLLDAVSDPGWGRPNEDSWGHRGHVAWVVDGATGVADEALVSTSTDARWLAVHASAALSRHARNRDDVTALVRAAIVDVARRFDVQARRSPRHRFERPTASLVVARAEAATLAIASLGDCTAAVLDAAGLYTAIAPCPRWADGEKQEAARVIALRPDALSCGVVDLLPEGLLEARRFRSSHNMPGGYWIFGLDPEAASHAVVARVPVTLPAVVLLMSDGFAAISERYGFYAPRELLQRAVRSGLEGIVAELRKIESRVDPDGSRFPRSKRSDDASAVLLALD